MAAPEAAQPSDLCGWQSPERGSVSLSLRGASAELSIAYDGSVRLRAAPGDPLPPDPAPGVGRAPWRSAPAEPYGREDGGVGMSFEGPEGEVEVEVVPGPLAVRIRDRAGALLAEIEELAFADDGRAGVSLRTSIGTRFYGFGEKSGGLDKRGQILRMRNRDPQLRLGRDPLYLGIPFFLTLARDGSRGCATGFHLESFAPARFDVAKADPRCVAMESLAGGIDLTVFPGPRPADVLRRMSHRLGRTPLPPLWALGHHQSRWSYRSAREVRALAREIRERGIPTDAIHLDIDYMDGYRVFTWHPSRFPDPGALCRELREQGFRLVTIVDPGVKLDERYAVYSDGRERGFFCLERSGSLPALRVWPGAAALPDFNREEVRAWWGEQHRPLLAAGVAGIWNDMNEPAGWKSDLRIGRAMLPCRAQDLSRMEQADPADPGRRVPHEHVRNVYGHQQCRATHGFLERAGEGRRPFLLSRSGYAGTQRYAAVWTGDNRSRWSDLRVSIPMLLNLSVSGIPFCGADIGGFAFSCTPELYARWIQLGALYPFSRTHAMWGKRRQEPWRFGPRVERIAREALELRMRLLPYLYGLFRESESTGAPVWRPLFYEFPDDPGSADVEDQLMLGPALMAAPVLRRGAREREVYLPPGHWIAWDDDARYAGPRRLTLPAPLERMPLFARAGSIIPTQSPVRHVGEAPREPLVLELFPGGDSALELYEDDGETTAYRGGEHATMPLRLRGSAGGRLRLEIGARQGPFERPACTLRAVVRSCPRPGSVWLDAEPLAEGVTAPGFEHEDGRLVVRFAHAGDSHVLEIEPAP